MKILLNYRNLTGRKLKSISFDITHDNPTLNEKYGNLGLNMTYICSNSMSGSAIGSTRGFDQLFPYQPSVVKENRVYEYDENFEILLEKNKFNLGDYNIREDFNEKKIEEKKILVKKIEEKEINKLTRFEFNPISAGITNLPVKVCMAISSNNWIPNITLEKNKNNIWSTEIELSDGVYEYKFVLDNNLWIYDKSKQITKDKNNNINNQIAIGKNNITIQENNSRNNNLADNGIFSKEFYINYKDLKLIRREMNFMRKNIFHIGNSELSEFMIYRDRDLIYFYRSLGDKKNSSSKSRDFDGYALICRTGFEKNSYNTITWENS